MTTNKQACTLVVHGRVQGVCYRASCQQQARLLGLQGWVANQADGHVRIVVEGPVERIEQFISWCWRGPAAARVDDIDIAWRPPSGELDDFTIRH